MTEKIRCALYSIMGIALGIVLLLPGGHVQASEKKTIYNSSYVSFSPDGEAWTTCAGDRNYKWYDENETTTVYTGIKSSWKRYGKESIITNPAEVGKYP